MAIVLHHSKAKGTAKLVLLGIANHEGDGGAWPSVATLSRYANIEPRAVQKLIGRLVSSGELVRDVQAGGVAAMGDWARPNRYQVRVSCPLWCDRTPQHRDTRPGQRGLWITSPDLGINRVSHRTPGVLQDTPPPVPQDTLTVSINPPPPGSSSTTDRARPCSECGMAPARCLSQQQAWPVSDRHDYTPMAQ